MPTAADFIKRAQAEVGYLETPVNLTKFAAMAGHPNGAAWCQTFLCGIAKNIGLPLPPSSSSTLYSIDGFRNKGQWYTSPQVGDFCYFNFDGTSLSGVEHVGVVTSIVDSRTVTTIEGNTSRPDGVNVNGGGVWARTRSRSYIVGYGRPAYTAGAAPPPPAPTSDTNMKIHSPVIGMAACAEGGYWQASADGGVFAFGGAGFYGSMGGHTLNSPLVGIVGTISGKGYWLVAADGGIFSFGDAKFYGSTGGTKLNKPIVGMAATRTGFGYWMVAADGGIFSFGDAKFYGSTGNIALNKPIVGMAATRSGAGYWLAASDGGIFAFGDAHFSGSTGNINLNKPVVGMAADPDNLGYWLVASDGGVFGFDAQFYGSTGNITLNKPVVGMCATPIVGASNGKGYWIYAADGGVFSFGDAGYYGSVSSL